MVNNIIKSPSTVKIENQPVKISLIIFIIPKISRITIAPRPCMVPELLMMVQIMLNIYKTITNIFTL